MIDWGDALSLTNTILAGIGAVSAFWYVWKHPKPFSWLKVLYGLIGLYWCLLYLYILYTDRTGTARIFGTGFGEVMVRPAFTLTLGVMAAGGLWRIRVGKP